MTPLIARNGWTKWALGVVTTILLAGAGTLFSYRETWVSNTDAAITAMKSRDEVHEVRLDGMEEDLRSTTTKLESISNKQDEIINNQGKILEAITKK